MTACALATIAACALIFSAGAQNVAHGYSLGLASSEFRAYVLAAASAGASVLGPFCWLAVFRGRGFGPRVAALVLALGCLAYAGICSLGFVSGARDAGISERTIAAESHADRRALVKAAQDELAQLRKYRPTRRIVERRAELTALLASMVESKPDDGAVARTDSQAHALAFYMRAAGWPVTDAAVGTWLNLGMVLFLELAAALSLTVAAALRPAPRRSRLTAPQTAEIMPATQVPADPETAATGAMSAFPDAKNSHGGDKGGDEPPAPPRPKGKGGRPATVLPAQAVERLRKAGGKANGSVRTVGKLLGAKSKTTAHRLIHRLQDTGLVRLTTSPDGVHVALA